MHYIFTGWRKVALGFRNCAAILETSKSRTVFFLQKTTTKTVVIFHYLGPIFGKIYFISLYPPFKGKKIGHSS